MSEPKKIIVIGGSAAGPKAAAKARRMDETAQITLIQKEANLSMAACGYPYYVGGTFDDRNLLLCTPAGVVRDPSFFQNAKAIEALTLSEVTSIDRAGKSVTYKSLETGETHDLAYDKLVIATGATPVRPPVPGTDLDGVMSLHALEEADALRSIRDEGSIKRAVIVGAGLIGFEVCEALRLAGIDITVVELAPQVLPFVDADMAQLVENHVRSQGADVITSNGVAAFLGEDGKLTGVKLNNGTELPCQLAVVAVGVRPNVALAEKAGLEIGALGGISVNDRMQTSDPDIYAAGDCVESTSLVTGEKLVAPLGDLANLQGRVVGQNVIAENSARFPGVSHTAICKVFDFNVGSTGLTMARARELGMTDVVSATISGLDIPGFMSGKLLFSKMIANAKTGQVLGFQCVGPGDVSKRVATMAMAIRGKLTIDDVANADLPYAPPFSLALDNVIVAAHVLENKIAGRMQGISAAEAHERYVEKADCVFIDTRSPQEFEQMRLGIGEILIPLGAIRKRLNELPADKDKEIIVYCKISLRGYEAVSILKAAGYTNVKVMEGGVVAWPYPREK